MKLSEHRKNLKNTRDFHTDLERCKGTLRNHLKACGYYNVPEHLLEKFVKLVFLSQQNRPFFYFETDTGTPVVWNTVKDWDKQYFRYEWGHLKSKNENKEQANNIHNLALLSGRGNQHIQSALDIDEVLETFEGSKFEKIARKNLKRRQLLFKHPQWKSMLDELSEYWAPTMGKSMNNPEVLKNYLQGKNGRAGSLHTNNGKLYSYDRVVSYVQDGTVYIYNYTPKEINGVEGIKTSTTTSRHVSSILKECKSKRVKYCILRGIKKETFKRNRGSFNKQK